MTHKEIIGNLRGVFPPVVTPFDRRGGIDAGRFRSNLQRYADGGLSGVVVAGSTGEAPYLNERERLCLIELARKAIKAPQLLIAGTGLEGTRETLRLSREAIERGADAVLLLPPAYYKARMDSPTLLAHFRALADSLRRSVIVYSIPQFTGFRMEAGTIAELSRHPNIIGVKESSGDLEFLKTILQKVRSGFRVLCGSAIVFLDSLRLGACGGVLGQAGFMPELCVAVYEAFQRGQVEAAQELQQKLAPLAQRIAIPYGISGIKAALDLCGYAGGAPRPPLLPLDSDARRAVAAVIRRARTSLES